MKRKLFVAIGLFTAIFAMARTSNQVYRMGTSGNLPSWGQVNLTSAAAIFGTLLPENGGVPPGTIMAYSGTTAPNGYIFADGTSYLRTTYPNLATVYNCSGSTCAHGAADTTHFYVIDLRGRFPRGTDNMGSGAAGVDPDASSRTNCKTSGNTGNAVGSCQGHAFQTHSHSITDPGHSHSITVWQEAAGLDGHVVSGNTSGASTTGGTNTATTGITGTNNASASGGNSQATSNETRPTNVYVMYIVKY